jgi:drug/metabolite transporter (DMT)-like permease
MSGRKAYVLLVVVVVVWAGNFPLGKVALREVSPFMLTAGRALIAAVLLLAIARVTSPLTRPFTRSDYRAFAVLGGSGLVVNTTLWFWGLSYTTAVNAGILGAASPVFVAVAASFVLHVGDRLRPVNWVGIVLSVAAVVLVVARGSLDVLRELSFERGDLIILGAQASWVVYQLYSRMASSTLPAIWIMAGAHVASAIVLVPLATITGAWRWPAAAPVGWLSVAYGATIITLSHLWYFRAIRTIGAGRAATFANLTPFVVLLLSWLIAGEQIHAYHVTAAAVVITGVYLTTR